MRYDTVFRQPRGHRLKKFCKTWAVAFVRASQTPYRLAHSARGERGERGGKGRGEIGAGILGDEITRRVASLFLSLSCSPNRAALFLALRHIETRIARVLATPFTRCSGRSRGSDASAYRKSRGDDDEGDGRCEEGGLNGGCSARESGTQRRERRRARGSAAPRRIDDGASRCLEEASRCAIAKRGIERGEVVARDAACPSWAA